MKTPREIILDQHRNAEARLAEIRAEDLAAMARSAQTVDTSPASRQALFLQKLREIILRDRRQSAFPTNRTSERVRYNQAQPDGSPSPGGEGWGEVRVRFIQKCYSIAQNFWQESILPWRRVWLGMAAVWFAILMFNFAAQTAPHVTLAKAPQTDSRIVLAAWRERRQMFAQLLGPVTPPSDAERKIPGPRSSLRIELMVV